MFVFDAVTMLDVVQNGYYSRRATSQPSGTPKADRAVQEYVYDTAGLLQTEIDAEGRRTEYERDVLGQVTQVSFAMILRKSLGRERGAGEAWLAGLDQSQALAEGLLSREAGEALGLGESETYVGTFAADQGAVGRSRGLIPKEGSGKPLLQRRSTPAAPSPAPKPPAGAALATPC